MTRRDCVPAMMIAAGAALALLGILLTGCATAPPPLPPVTPPSLFPPLLSVDSLLPPAPPPVKLPPGVKRDPLPVDSPNACRLPEGILLDDVSFAETIAIQAERDRLRTETRVMHDLRIHDQAAVLDAEAAYQRRLGELEQQNAKLREPHPWERWLFIGGFVAGAAGAVMATYAGTRASR